MRQISAWLLAVALLAPLLAPRTLRADNTVGSSECRHLASQINFYESRLDRAEELGNELWEQRLESHLAMLKDRAGDRCPELADDNGETMRQIAALLRLAAKGALTFFTMGAAGF